jgi:hypothetical protein
MLDRSLTLSLVCCESRGEIMRVLRSRNSGSVPKLQSMLWGNTEKLTFLIPAPQRRGSARYAAGKIQCTLCMLGVALHGLGAWLPKRTPWRILWTLERTTRRNPPGNRD